ncbi:hypothetical protein ABPG77_000691 [Micractinium sp. CCAP 211/92]
MTGLGALLVLVGFVVCGAALEPVLPVTVFSQPKPTVVLTQPLAVGANHGAIYGSVVTTCRTYNTSVGDWIRGKTRYDAKGSAIPSTSAVTTLKSLICSDQRAAAKQILSAVEAGGSQAQVAVYALLNADCPSSGSGTASPVSKTCEGRGIGDPADLAATKAFFTAFAKAADAVGIPVCATVALVDDASGSVLEQTQYHTG